MTRQSGKRARRLGAGSDRGQVLVLFAVFMVTGIALIAFVTDIAHGFMLKRHLQSAADAAALAAVQELPDTPADAQAMAHSYSAATGGENARGAFPGVTTTVCFPTGPSPSPCPALAEATSFNRVRVTQRATSGVFFGGILGFGGFTVSATAVATVTEEPSGEKFLLYSNRTDCTADVLKLNGNNQEVLGAIRSNGGITINGSGTTVGTTTSACDHQGDTAYDDDIAVDDPPAYVEWPVYWSYAADGDGTLGSPMTPFPLTYCPLPIPQTITISGDGTPIPDGVYCAWEKFELSGNNHPPARITVLAPEITIGGNGNNLRYFDEQRQLLFFATRTVGLSTNTPPCPASGNKELVVNGGGYTLEGVLFNPCERVTVNGDNASFLKGFLVGKSVLVNGDGFRLEGIGPPPTTGGERLISLVE